ATAFAGPPEGVDGSLVITAGRGLLPPATIFGIDDLRALADVPIDATEPRYRDPLVRDALRLREAVSASCEIVLLGSLATPKYLEPLIEIFGERLLVPSAFVGRGDMSRGGLLLRCVTDRVELDYMPASGALLHGERPPKLPKVPRQRASTA